MNDDFGKLWKRWRLIGQLVPLWWHIQHAPAGPQILGRLDLPEWAVLAATTYDDAFGNVTPDEQYATCAALLARKQFLGQLVDRLLF